MEIIQILPGIRIIVLDPATIIEINQMYKPY
jgi:hypothetical protein